jgi:drug/metabolite transporter (DMT)-like permease
MLRGSPALVTEIAVSVAICVLTGFLIWGSIAGRTGTGDLNKDHAVLGIVLTLVCGLASTGNVIYAKRLSEGGQSPQSVMSVRFFLLIIVTWGMVAADDQVGLAASFLPATLIGIIGVALPLYLIQVGVRYMESITVTLLSTLSPIFAFLLQLADRRLHPSALTFVCILGITALVAFGILARRQIEISSRCEHSTNGGTAIQRTPVAPQGRVESV